MAIKTGFNNAKGGGGGGSETSGCYLLNNASSLRHLYAYTYEGDLRDIDNRSGFTLKASDTLIGDDGYCYKLMMINEDLGTFTCTKFWALNSIPKLLIDFSQFSSQNEINLSSEQVELLTNFSVLYLDIPPASDVIHQVIVKNENTSNNKLSFTGYELDTTNNQVKVNEFLIDTTGNTMTISSITLGASKQLYQHNITLFGNSISYSFRLNPIMLESDDEITSLHELWLLLNAKGFCASDTDITTDSGVARGRFVGITGRVSGSNGYGLIASSSSQNVFYYQTGSGTAMLNTSDHSNIKDIVF